MTTYTGGIEVAGPGAAAMTGKGVAAHWKYHSQLDVHELRTTRLTYSMLHICPGLPSREGGDVDLCRGRNWDDLRTVRQKRRIVPKDSHLLHYFLELGHHGPVVGCSND